jgi:hypothetical protein
MMGLGRVFVNAVVRKTAYRATDAVLNSRRQHMKSVAVLPKQTQPPQKRIGFFKLFLICIVATFIITLGVAVVQSFIPQHQTITTTKGK